LSQWSYVVSEAQRADSGGGVLGASQRLFYTLWSPGSFFCYITVGNQLQEAHTLTARGLCHLPGIQKLCEQGVISCSMGGFNLRPIFNLRNFCWAVHKLDLSKHILVIDIARIVCSGVYVTVHCLSVCTIYRPLLRVCCRVPGGQTSITAGQSAAAPPQHGTQQQLWAVPRWQLM